MMRQKTCGRMKKVKTNKNPIFFGSKGIVIIIIMVGDWKQSVLSDPKNSNME